MLKSLPQLKCSAASVAVCVSVEGGNSLLLWFLHAGGYNITATFPGAFPDAELQKRERFPATPTPGRQVQHGWLGALQP